MANYNVSTYADIVSKIAIANSTSAGDNLYFLNDITLTAQETINLLHTDASSGTLRFRSQQDANIPGDEYFTLTVTSALNIVDNTPETAQPSFTIGPFILKLGDGTTDGSIQGNFRADDGGILVFNNKALTTTYTGTFSVEEEDNAIRNDVAGTTVIFDASATTATAAPGGGGNLAIRASQSTGDAANYELEIGGDGDGVISGIIADSGFLTITRPNAQGVPTTLDKAGNLEKDGDGTWTLSGANTYVGTTTVEEGTLVIANNTGLGATIAFNGVGAAITAPMGSPTPPYTAPTNGTLGTAAQSGTVVEDGATLALKGNIVVGAEALSIAGEGAGEDEDEGESAGALHNLSGNNTFGGAITLTDDALISSESGTLTLTGNISAAVVQADGATVTDATLTLGDEGDGVITGIISDGVLSGTGVPTGTRLPLGIVKEGDGTWRLSGVNTYTGDTTVSEGTLLVTGSIANSFTTVGEEGTLGGTGKVGTLFVESEGTLSAGVDGVANGVGTLDTRSLLMFSDSVLNLDLGGTANADHDRINVVGSVTLNGATLDLSLVNGLALAAGQTFEIITNDGSDAVRGTFADEDGNAIEEGGFFEFEGKNVVVSYKGGTGNDVTLTVNTAPVAIDDVKAVNQRATATGNVITGGTPDSDANGGVLSVVAIARGAGDPEDVDEDDGATIDGRFGSLTIAADGTYTYDANVEGRIAVGATATDVFTYTLSDGQGDEATATLSVTVTGSASGNADANIFLLTGPGTSARGFGGDDTYYVDSQSDTPIEVRGGGNDTVITTVSYALAANTEIETLRIGSAGTAPLKLTGNGFANTLIGNDGANTLDGGGGADVLRGGNGSDTYIVDNVGDIVREAAGAGSGTDTVLASVTYTLSANVETLRLTGSANISGTGNALANTIIGNSGANTLNGGLGNDILTGGAGRDTFLFNTALDAAKNLDHIKDFNVKDDTISLENAFFKALKPGALHADEFALITSGTQTVTSDAHILYNKATGALYYDSNGGDAAGRVQFAVLDNHAALTFQDFHIV